MFRDPLDLIIAYIKYLGHQFIGYGFDLDAFTEILLRVVSTIDAIKFFVDLFHCQAGLSDQCFDIEIQ